MLSHANTDSILIWRKIDRENKKYQGIEEKVEDVIRETYGNKDGEKGKIIYQLMQNKLARSWLPIGRCSVSGHGYRKNNNISPYILLLLERYMQEV